MKHGGWRKSEDNEMDKFTLGNPASLTETCRSLTSLRPGKTCLSGVDCKEYLKPAVGRLRGVTYKKTFNQRDQGSRKNWGMTAFSKELAVVSRVVCFSRLADLLQEEGTSTGIAGINTTR